MATRKFALTEGGEKRLEIQQPPFSQTRVVKLDGKVISEIANMSALKAGREYLIDDGKTLSIRYVNSLLNQGLDVRVDGKPVPGSVSHPGKQLSNTSGAIIIIGAINIIVGIITLAGNRNFLGITGLDSRASIVSGIAYAVLAYFVYRHSQIALGLALTGFAIDTIALVLSLSRLMNNPNPNVFAGAFSGLFVRLFFAAMMIQGFFAIRKLKTEE